MLRFKIYNTGKVALSDSLPVLERMGARVLDEHPYRIGMNGDAMDSRPGLAIAGDTDLATVKDRFESLFASAWRGEVESDDLNKLVLLTQLDARGISVLRAYTRYFKQLGFAFQPKLYRSHAEQKRCDYAGHLQPVHGTV
jgi:glutamate dehydrogenase